MNARKRKLNYVRKFENWLGLVVVCVDFDVSIVPTDDQVLDAVAGDIIVVDRLEHKTNFKKPNKDSSIIIVQVDFSNMFAEIADLVCK
jgi:hypothetical protein